MSKHPTSQPPTDQNTSHENNAPAPVVADDSVDTENPNDSVEAYHERLRTQIQKE